MGRPAIKSPDSNRSGMRLVAKFLPNIVSFLLGCLVCTTTILLRHTGDQHIGAPSIVGPTSFRKTLVAADGSSKKSDCEDNDKQVYSFLQGTRILVAIAAYDFSQLPHLEEVLSSYRDVCEAGAIIDLYIHTTIPFPVALIDLLSNRLACTTNQYHIIVSVKTPAVRLNLVDFHRTLFYDKLEDYDLFIYSEDDIRVTPTTVAAFLYETARVESLVGKKHASDFNVGIVRYEYNYPPNLIIEDKTRHATKNVTRVYWEHLSRPTIPESVDAVPHDALKSDYVYMTNHHQGMFLATRFLLREWKVREGCNFDIVRQRPGLKIRPLQPSEGTQRVWMR